MTEHLDMLAVAVTEGRVEDIGPLIEEALSSGISAQELLNGGLMAGMSVVGELFKRDEMFIPEVLRCGKAMQTGIDQLRSQFGQQGVSGRGVVVIGTVKGDFHDIGRNLVAMMLECAGFDVITLGIDIAPEQFVEAVNKYDPDIVAMSALLTTTRGAMGDSIQAMEAAGVRDRVKVLVGGACVNQSFADQIEADGYAPDAARGLDKALELLGQR